jgi:uncharacterized membrane protein
MRDNSFLTAVFPKGRIDPSSLIIKLFTWGDVSHIETLLDNKGKTITTDISKGVYYANKIRYKKIREIELNFIVPIEIEIAMRRYIDSFIGKKYDKLGTIKSLFSWFFQSENKYFCSELYMIFIKKLFELMGIEEFKNINPSNMTPEEVENLLLNSKYFKEKKK